MAGEKIKILFKKNTPYILFFFILLVVVTAVKIYVIAKYNARWWSDSFDYFYYGERILSGNFFSPEAKRAIGYPLFIAFSFLSFGIKHNSIAFMQVVFGFFSLYLFYSIQKDMRIGIKSNLLNLTIFLLGPLSYFELSILTESFSVFTALLYFRQTQLYLAERKKLNAVLSVAAALLMVLTRPQFIIPLLLVNAFLFFKNYKKYSVVFSALFVFVLLGYSGMNYIGSNYFGLSSYLGYNIINHTGDFIEEAKELNPGLVNIYVNKREQFKKEYNGNQEFAIWGCIDELYKKMDYDFLSLSKELTRISLHLIITHPLKYAASVSKALYKTFIYTEEYNHEDYDIRIPSFISLFIFVAGTIFLLIISSGNIFINSVKILFFVNLLFSAMLDIGENFRHILPLMFVLIAAFTAGCYLVSKKVVFEKLSENTI